LNIGYREQFLHLWFIKTNIIYIIYYIYSYRCQVLIQHRYLLYIIIYFAAHIRGAHKQTHAHCTRVYKQVYNTCLIINIYYKLAAPSTAVYRWLVPTRRTVESEVRWTEPCDLRGRAIVIVTARSTNTDPVSMCYRINAYYYLYHYH